MVYFTVASKDTLPGAIKRAYIPSVDDGSNNVGAAVDLDIKYITRPDGIAVDWVGRCVRSVLTGVPSVLWRIGLKHNLSVETISFNLQDCNT